VLKVYCYNSETRMITECATDVKERVRLNLKIKLSKEARNRVRNFNVIYGFMVLKGGPYVFKVYDGTRDTGAVTLEMKRSKRSEVKGKECKHHSIGEMEDIAKNIRMPIKGKEKGSKDLFCVMLEYELRKYDMEKHEGKRWFLNAIEEMKRRF